MGHLQQHRLPVLADGAPDADTLDELVDAFCWDTLAVHHSGFEIDDGGFGRFTIDVATGAIELEHNDRYVDYTTGPGDLIMAHPYHHALSSVRKWGGVPADYIAIHAWFDESKQIIADYRHRALRHHAEGIFMAERIFGVTITLSTGHIIPTRWVSA